MRLTLNGGRETLVRLLVTAAGVALGVGMLLVALAGINAVNTQNGKYAWLETGTVPAIPASSSSSNAPMWWLLTADEFHGKSIARIDVATTGPTSAVPPGMSRLPGPGQYFASPAMSRLLHSVPAAELADRYPGHQVGTIGAAGLPSPTSLVVVVGRTPASLANVRGASRVTSLLTQTPHDCNGACFYVGAINASGIDLVLAVSAAALLFPILIFIGTASRLSTARREQRFAAMRLVGATPSQISVISAVESLLAAVLGVAVGFAVFFGLRVLIAPIPFTGARFFTSDLALNLRTAAVVAVGVPLAAVIAARIALRRAQASPLGVSRRTTPPAPRAYRLIPLVVGLGELAYFVHAGRPQKTSGQIDAYLTGILITMAGLVIAGPWLTMAGSRLMARRTRKPATLLAARRLSDNPRAGFRAISGLVIALFVTSVAMVLITTITAYNDDGRSSPAAARTLVDSFADFRPHGVGSDVRSVPASLTSSLATVRGVTGVSVLHLDPADLKGSEAGQPSSLVSCTALAATPAIGRCTGGAQTASIKPDLRNLGSLKATNVTWPASRLSSSRIDRLPALYVVVETTGSTAAIEQARTILERSYPLRFQVSTIAEIRADDPNTARTTAYQRLVDVVILASLPIAGCSLAVSVIAGLGDRRRPFSLLRLTGTPISLLRRVIAFETAVPLLLISVFSIGVGFLASWMFLRSQLSESLHSPGLSYYLLVVVGLIVSLGVIATTFPMLERTTGPEAARND